MALLILVKGSNSLYQLCPESVRRGLGSHHHRHATVNTRSHQFKGSVRKNCRQVNTQHLSGVSTWPRLTEHVMCRTPRLSICLPAYWIHAILSVCRAVRHSVLIVIVVVGLAKPVSHWCLSICPSLCVYTSTCTSITRTHVCR